MSTVRDSDAVGDVEMAVDTGASLDGRAANANDTGGSKDDVTTGQEIGLKENGVKDEGLDIGVQHLTTHVDNYCGEIPVKSQDTKLNGMNRKEITSNTWTSEELEDDCIVDFLDKNNDKVRL